ncbi:MAG: hypothetical protein MMC23_007593 [Stictis urceolatum]|nr:hypothetical protein [Stictis urceolata]
MEEAAEAAEATASLLNFSHVSSQLYNTTASFIPSPKDLFLLVPRMASRVPALFSSDFPYTFENLFGGPLTGRVIASATGTERDGASLAAAAAAAGQTVAGAATVVGDVIGDNGIGGIGEAAGGNRGGFIQGFDLKQLRTFGGVFTYVTSKWALGCFTAAIVLNRTSIYASARRHLRLEWQWRLMVRLVPIIMLLSLSQELTRALRCQTSPGFSEMRYGIAGKHAGLDYSGEGGMLHSISSTMLMRETDEESCRAVGMIPREEKPKEFPRGSLALLWPSFQAFCAAQWVETLLCALQGRQPATETGMSLFEHSLAFAEAEAMMSNQIGLSPWGSGDKRNGSSQKVVGEGGAKETTEATVLVTKSFIVSRFNTPPEVLLMALISALNNLTSQVLGVFDLQARYRLLSTGIWGMGFMASFLWGFITFSVDQGINSGILRFPTVCVVGFIPHTLILLGIGLCAYIYGIALGISVLSPPEGYPRNVSWTQRFRVAHQNMQANIPLSGLRINWREDFYTALLRVGFTALTAASEAVFLNEGRRINVGQWTWLEEERLEEIARLKAAAPRPEGLDSTYDSIANGVILAANEDTKLLGDDKWESGYAREKNTKALKGGLSHPQRNPGVGADQRGSRYRTAGIFLTRIFWLLVGWMASVAGKTLAGIGISNYPRWFPSHLVTNDSGKGSATLRSSSQQKEIDFWMLTDDGRRVSPTNREVDVEVEFRKRESLGHRKWGAEEEAALDSTLYKWFVRGGWWGEQDSSGAYEEQTSYGGLDDDATSVISTTETEPDDEDWASSDALTDGQRTPTQTNLFSSQFTSTPTPRPISRSSTPFSTSSTHSLSQPSHTHPPTNEDTPLDPTTLARLLSGQDPEARREARMLAAHLSSPSILTRSQYRSVSMSANAHILTSTRQRPPGFSQKSPDGKLTSTEEAEILEWLIITRRERKMGARARTRGDGAREGAGGGEGEREEEGQSWEEGGGGLGSRGPMCVVCQTSARTILAWPCRCLSLCEECRVSLAMNNFATCVCCRQEVVGFSRLFVP